MSLAIQFIIDGILIGSIYSLLAVSIVAVFKSTAVFNFAVGQMLVLGGFFAWSFLSWFHLNLWVSLALSMVASAVLGYAVQRFIFDRLIGQPLFALFGTSLALGVFLSGIMILVWGSISLPFPEKLLPVGSIALAKFGLSKGLLAGFAVAMVFLVVLSFFYYRTGYGLEMRATAEDHQLARATGVRAKKIFAMTWAVGAVTATIAGIILGDRLGLTVGSLPAVAVRAFPAVLLGGLESIPGAVIGGLIVGVTESLVGGLISSRAADISPFVVLLLILLIRPTGLFGLERIDRI